MIIDFHTHTFPDKVADKVIAHLSEKGGIPAYTDGKISSLRASQKRAGITYSVILPVATTLHQVESINRLAKEENGKDGIIYAGAIHPDCPNVEEVLDGIKNAGLFGIKIHPDYQGAYFDDERYLRIIGEAAKRDLVIVTHAGLDVGYPDDIHCTPDMVLRVLNRLGKVVENKLVLAHMGGCDMADEVEQKLAGKPVYFDTAFVLDRYPEGVNRLIKAHGADKVLFATDSPWADQQKFVQLLKSYDISDSDKEKIFSLNAKKLLHISGEEYSPSLARV